MDLSGIAAAAAVLGVPLCIWMLKKSRWLRADPPPPDAPDLKSLQARFGKWMLIEAVVGIVTAALTTWVWFHVLTALLNLIQREPGDSLETLHIWRFAAVGPAMALGIASSLPLTIMFDKLCLREKYSDYVLLGERLYGLKAARVGAILVTVISIPAILFTVLAVDCYAACTETNLVINRFWSFGDERYPYSEVREVRAVESFRAPNGKIVRRPFHEVEFGDGSVWSPKHLMRDPETITEVRFMERISVKSGKSIVKHEFKPDSRPTK